VSVAALGDTADSYRGTIISDQAHNLGNELINLLTDSYKQGGGKRRVIDLNGKRKVLEFDCYCPKVFASQQSLPEDLADRTFTINMAPASKAYPCPSASKRDWVGIRTSLVELMLTQHKDMCQLVEDFSDTEGHRFGELWLPMELVLTLCQQGLDEVEGIKSYCEQQFSQVKYELRDWDYAVVWIVANHPEESISSGDLLESLQQELSDVPEDKRPGKIWLGKTMKRLGLFRERKGGKREETYYLLDKEHANKLLGRVGKVGESV